MSDPAWVQGIRCSAGFQTIEEMEKALREFRIAQMREALKQPWMVDALVALGWTPPRAGEIASAADCHLGPLAQAARAKGQDVRVWHNGCGHYVAEAGKPAGIGKTAQEACDRLEIALGEVLPHLERFGYADSSKMVRAAVAKAKGEINLPGAAT